MASSNTAKWVQSRWRASKLSSNITIEALDGIYLTLQFVLSALLLQNLVYHAHFSLSHICSFQGAWRAPPRPYGFIGDGGPQNSHPSSPSKPWTAFISLFHLFWVRYYSRTSSPSSDGHFSLSRICSFQGSWRAPPRQNGFIADGVPQSPHPSAPSRLWM